MQSNNLTPNRADATRLASLALLMKKRGTRPAANVQQNVAQLGTAPADVMTPIELDMIKLALRRDPQNTMSVLRTRSAQTMSVVTRVAALSAEQKPLAIAEHIQRLRGEGAQVPEFFEQIPLSHMDQLLAVMERRAMAVLYLVEEEDRLSQLEAMLGADADEDEVEDAVEAMHEGDRGNQDASSALPDTLLAQPFAKDGTDQS